MRFWGPLRERELSKDNNSARTSPREVLAELNLKAKTFHVKVAKTIVRNRDRALVHQNCLQTLRPLKSLVLSSRASSFFLLLLSERNWLNRFSLVEQFVAPSNFVKLLASPKVGTFLGSHKLDPGQGISHIQLSRLSLSPANSFQGLLACKLLQTRPVFWLEAEPSDWNSQLVGQTSEQHLRDLRLIPPAALASSEASIGP